MFSHILVPTDGSELAEKACRAAIAFAKEVGARITAYYAVEPLVAQAIGDGYLFPARGNQRASGTEYVKRLAQLARAAGVPFESLVNESADAADGIAAAADRARCDVIFMASHGRRGLDRLAEGSVTADVLAKAKVPVLVYR
jgi:nucleotide-binding universal stress UspA family protein